ncbi:putative receptor-like protein kinase [Capsicum baccatum]|uniref:non-specific serine/threonine protein kinase n=1 Tax=Capsicum baccatum TaxID=33114 RepID=A0A2G2VKA2_CAPBA|nr:putative receptor-like protein kinase [Capsicum baccatum]
MIFLVPSDKTLEEVFDSENFQSYVCGSIILYYNISSDVYVAVDRPSSRSIMQLPVTQNSVAKSNNSGLFHLLSDRFTLSWTVSEEVAVDGTNAEESGARSEGPGHHRNMKNFSNVYKGSLCNGSHVAVKVLNGLKGNGEEFINEVASISKTSHVNIVSLVGFCFEGRKRALVYEFMPNGSLEKIIYEERSEIVRQLGWPILYKIGLGIARGLEYLHRGCTTRILHFDIKPHNILLDEDFCPKISDFGLAKLCVKKESIVSTLGARGTIGYIAPEIWEVSLTSLTSMAKE